MDLERFSRWADEMVGWLPPQLLEGLNGGIVIAEEARRRSDDPPGVYILGEYITDPYLGARIAIYYGSFRRLFRSEPASVWRDELWTTIKHEVRHHMEGRAGLADLELEDLMELERMRREAREHGRQ